MIGYGSYVFERCFLVDETNSYQAQADEGIEEEEEEESRSRVKRVGVALLILLLLLLLLLYLAGLRQPDDPAPEIVAPISFEGTWTELAEFTGRTVSEDVTALVPTRIEQTLPFITPGEQWRITWESSPAEGGLLSNDTQFVFFLRPTVEVDGQGDNLLIVGIATEPRDAVWNMRTPPGEYFFNVETRNSDWSIKIESLDAVDPPGVPEVSAEAGSPTE